MKTYLQFGMELRYVTHFHGHSDNQNDYWNNLAVE